MKMKSKKIRKTVVWSLTVLVLGIMGLEIGARAVLYLSLKTYFEKHIPAPYSQTMKEIHLAPIMEASWCRFDPLCYYVPKDGFFRGPSGQYDLPKTKRQKEVRILCIGDSTTYGDAVPYRDSWPALLERKLKTAYPDADLRVLNAGIPGASSRQVKRVFQKYLVHYGPDIVIWRKGMFLTDSYDIDETPTRLRALIWRILYESRLFRMLCVWIDGGRDWKWRTAEKIYDAVTNRTELTDGRHHYKADICLVKRIARDNGISRVLALDYVTVTGENAIISDCRMYREEEIAPRLCTVDRFRKELETVPLKEIFVDDCHLTELGTRMIAEQVHTFIAGSGWLTDSPSGGGPPCGCTTVWDAD